MQADSPPRSWLLMLKSEEEIEQVAQEEILSICGASSQCQKLHTGVVEFCSDETNLAKLLALELLGSLYVVLAQIDFSGMSSTQLLDALQRAAAAADDRWLSPCRRYMQLRGGRELPNNISFKTYFRCLQGAQPPHLPLPKDLMAVSSEAIAQSLGWSVNLQSPLIEVAVFVELAKNMLFITANLTRQRKGKVVTGELVPTLNRAQNEEYCKRVLNRLRKRRREKKELDESPQNDSSADHEGGTAEEQATEEAEPGEPPRRLRKAEAILQRRTSRIVIVLEKTVNEHNHYAVLRTAECFGIQHVWFVLHASIADDFHINRKITKQKEDFLSIRTFNSTADCISACRNEGMELWATDLSLEAVNLDDREELQKLSASFPKRVALVIGSESTGISSEMLAAANRRLYYPLQGFSESLNLSVATALIVQRLFDVCPSARGDMSEEERKSIRADWYAKLAHTAWQRVHYPIWAVKPPPPLTDLRRLEEHRTPWLPPKILNKNTSV